MNFEDKTQKIVYEILDNIYDEMLTQDEIIQLVQLKEDGPYIDWYHKYDKKKTIVPGRIYTPYKAREAITKLIEVQLYVTTLKECSELLKVNIETLKKACQNGKINARKSGSIWLVNVYSARNYFEGGKQNGI